ncbi:cytochrome c-type biogenesis protein CcmH, partial [Rhizobium sp. SEMIA 4085]
TDGDTDEEVLNYIVSRYGEFVLLKPRLSTRTMLLWGAPVLLVMVGFAAIVFTRRQHAAPHVALLTKAEQKDLQGPRCD